MYIWQISYDTKPSANRARRKAAGAKSSSDAQKYLERRRKNTKASRLSRQKRKQRETDMKKELSSLKEENDRLQNRVTQLETQLERSKQKIMSAFVHAVRRAPYGYSNNELW